VAFIVALSAGVIGGTFAPSLFMGAALGAAIGHFSQRLLHAPGINPSAYSLVGMGSFFAGLLRSPIAAVLIVVELTRDYDLMIPLMLAVSLSVAVSRRISRHSMVEQQNFSDYTVARMTDIPAFDVHIVPSAEPPTGMGEPGLPPLAPAFANAITQLTGKPLRQLPFNIESKSKA